MRRALRLAARGYGQTSPNPMVGAVVVRRGKVVGEGFHRFEQRTHAEVLAIEASSGRSQGSTLYVTLEPCTHHGRTPPCVEAVVAARIGRVVAAMADPTEKVNGRGFERLRRSGIDVRAGLLEKSAARLNEYFIKFSTRGGPFVLLKAGMTLDGRIATARGESRWITSQAARQFGQKLRRGVDAILAGSGTILQDDPYLSYRLAARRARPLVKVVLDTQLRTPLDANVLRQQGGESCLIFCSAAAPSGRRQALEAKGATVLPVRSCDGLLDLEAVLQELAGRQILSVLVEGGAAVHWSFIERRLADKILCLVAPKILGGSAIPVVAGQGFERLADAVQLRDLRARKLGEELVVEGYF